MTILHSGVVVIRKRNPVITIEPNDHRQRDVNQPIMWGLLSWFLWVLARFIFMSLPVLTCAALRCNMYSKPKK